jgi:hypothetical protein
MAIHVGLRKFIDTLGAMVAAPLRAQVQFQLIAQ